MFAQPLSRSVARVTGKALDRKAAALGTLLGAWETVAGRSFSAVSVPIKLSRSPQAQDEPAILHIAVPSAWKTEFQHEAPHLIARINGFFGFRAVAEVRLSARSLPQRIQPMAASRPSALNCADIATRVKTIGDPALQAALIRLGEAMGAK